MNWTDVPRAVDLLLQLVDDREPRFRVARITVTPSESEAETLVVAAFDERGRAFEYAVHVPHSGEMVTDGR